MFKTQLVNIEKGRIIPDKNNKGQTLMFDVLKFVEINKQTNVPTGETRDKWYNPNFAGGFSNCLSNIDLKIGNYYDLILDLSGNVVDIIDWEK